MPRRRPVLGARGAAAVPFRRSAAVAAVLALAGCATTAGHGSYALPAPPTRSAAGTPTPAPGPPRPVTPTISAISFRDCTGDVRPQLAGEAGADRDLRFGCGRLSVPLDYTRPDAASVDLVLIRVRLAGQRQRIGSLVVNPGGPGGSGVSAAIGLGLRLSPDLLRRFDLVGFDPRGVGLSNPVQCVPAALKDRATALDPDARTPAQFAAQVAVATEAGQGCRRKYGTALAHYSTEETARDLDLVRQAVGDPALSYLGYSYGTRLGSVYATLFPRRIRAMVLDGAVDPSTGELAGAETQARGFEDAYDQFAADCRRRGPACRVGPDARVFLSQLLDTARRAPIPSSRAGETRKATAGHVLLAAVSALYDAGDWPNLEGALSDAAGGDSVGVLSLADQYAERQPNGTYSNVLDANLAVNCADSAERTPAATVRATVAAWRTRYPLFGTSLALGLLGCDGWPAAPHPLPALRAAGAPPVVVVGTLHDPATPYTGAVRLAARLGAGVLLSWDGQGHTAYPRTRCVARAVDTYLVSLRPPATGTTCPRS